MVISNVHIDDDIYWYDIQPITRLMNWDLFCSCQCIPFSNIQGTLIFQKLGVTAANCSCPFVDQFQTFRLKGRKQRDCGAVGHFRMGSGSPGYEPEVKSNPAPWNLWLLEKGNPTRIMLSCWRRAFQGSTNIWCNRSVLCFWENRQNASYVFRNHMKRKKASLETSCLLATYSLVETWWGETWWKHFENLVKIWWKPGENLVNTWWNCQNLVKTWWNSQNLVKTWWNWLKKCFAPWNFTKRSVFFLWNLSVLAVKLKAKHEPGENLVKFPEPGELSKVGDK